MRFSGSRGSDVRLSRRDLGLLTSDRPCSRSAIAVRGPLAAFEVELADARSEADLRGVRDRYLARKGGLVSGLLKSLGQARRPTTVPDSASSPTAEGRHRGSGSKRLARDRQRVTPAGGRRRRHAAGPPAAHRPPPSADDPARAHRSHLHALRLPRHRGRRARRRLPQLRSAQHAAGASRARHAGHPVPVVAGAFGDRARRRRSCGRTPRGCRSATWRSISRRCG